MNKIETIEAKAKGLPKSAASSRNSKLLQHQHSSPGLPGSSIKLPLGRMHKSMQCLFPMGTHRSGTTWVHQLLASNSNISFITYKEILQFIQPKGRKPKQTDAKRQLLKQGDSRGFDTISIGMDKPEEHGWILESSAFGMYTRRPISNANFEPLKALIQQKREQATSTQWLILKNPVDFYDGTDTLAKKFPNSYFLFLHRHPYSVFQSQVRSWRHPYASPNHYLATLDRHYATTIENDQARKECLDKLYTSASLETILLTLAETFEVHAKRSTNFSPESLHLRYEDICFKPLESLSQISE